MEKIYSMARVHGTGDVYESLFYVEDTTNNGYGIVSNVPGFSWYREKSNDTVRDRNRGFSFYYARLVYKDANKLIKYDSEHSTQEEDHWHIIGHPWGLNSDILMVVETDKRVFPDKIHIVSAMVLTKPNLIKEYHEGVFSRKRQIDYLASLMDKTF